MDFPVLLAEFDWSQVFYFLIPLVYVAAQFFGGDKEKKQKPQGGGKAAAPEAKDQLRKVREEIRRKVAERQEQMRRAMEGEVGRPIERSSRPQESGKYDPNTPEWAQRPGESTAPPPVPQASTPAPAPASRTPAMAEEHPLDRQLREQRDRLKKAQEARKAAFAKAREVVKTKGTWAKKKPSATSSAGSTRSQVLASLKTPGSARTAIVLSEVLGPPRSMRPFEERV